MAALDEGFAGKVLAIKMSGREGVVVCVVLCHLHSHIAKQLDLIVHIDDIGDVLDAYRFIGQQHGTEHLQGLVFSALRCNIAFQPMSALDNE